jgi:hypothetical protein
MGKGKYAYRKKKPDGRKYSLVSSAHGFFGPIGEKNPPIKIQSKQDNLEHHGTRTLVRINMKTKKWELWKKK